MYVRMKEKTVLAINSLTILFKSARFCNIYLYLYKKVNYDKETSSTFTTRSISSSIKIVKTTQYKNSMHILIAIR